MKNYKIIMLTLLMLSPITASATPISSADVLGNWTAGGSPIDGDTVGVWQQPGSTITGTENHTGSLISDFSNGGNFSFSVNSQAQDNDIFGLMWGVQDNSNHYRFSWGQEYLDTGNSFTGSGGFRIFKEVGGVATQLYASNTVYSFPGANYNLNVVGSDSGFNVLVTEGMTSIFDVTIADTTFTSGRVGIHDWFQTDGNIWSNFDNSQTVPAPSIIALFILGLIGLGFARRRRQV